MTRVNIPISLDTAFEALANLAGDSGGAPVATELSKASWCAGIFSCVGWRRHGPCEAGRMFHRHTLCCRYMQVHGPFGAELGARARHWHSSATATGHCQGLRRGCCPHERYQLRVPCWLRYGATGSGAGSRRVTTCRRHYRVRTWWIIPRRTVSRTAQQHPRSR